MARVPATTGGGAVPRKGRVPRRYQERERARDQRKLAPADGLCALRAYLLAGAQASFRTLFWRAGSEPTIVLRFRGFERGFERGFCRRVAITFGGGSALRALLWK